MSLSQGYSVGKVLFLPVLNDSGSDCTIVTLNYSEWPIRTNRWLQVLNMLLKKDFS
jgi:hypothetical protein